MKVLFNSLNESSAKRKREVNSAIDRVVKSGIYILGREVQSFEKKFARYLGVKYVVGCASGTEAIALALMSLGVKGEVITQANTCVPTIVGIIMAGCTPRLVDISKNGYAIDDDRVEKNINSKTAAILPVHLYGRPNISEKLINIGKKHRIPIVEDCAQAHGAEWKGKKAGSLGLLGCFSFYPTKNLGCFGDGGAVSTSSKELYELLLSLRNYGQKDRYHSVRFGINSRLDELQSAILTAKLPYLDECNEKRRILVKLYNELIDTPHVTKIPASLDGKSSNHLYVVLCEDRDELQKYLLENGIQTLIHYPVPIHLQEAYRYLGYKKGEFPVAESFAGKILSLPLYPALGSKEVKYICSNINKFYAGRTK